MLDFSSVTVFKVKCLISFLWTLLRTFRSWQTAAILKRFQTYREQDVEGGKGVFEAAVDGSHVPQTLDNTGQ